VIRVAWLAMLALAGCDYEVKETAQPPPDQADNPPPVAPLPPPAPPASAPLLTADGYGPLRIGMTRAEVEAALGLDADANAVGGPEPDSCDQFRPARAPEGMLVMVQDGRLARVSLNEGSAVKTAHGLGLGAPAGEVRAKLKRVEASAHEYADPPAEYLTWWAKGGPSAGRTAGANARGIRYEVGGEGRVDSIHAGGPAIQLVEGCL
jgi:hypothetical protein